MARSFAVATFVVLLTIALAQTLPNGFVHLSDVDPSIVQDIRYVTHHNFIGWPVYGYLRPTCILTVQAATALSLVQKDLLPLGFSLKVYDCYRPQMAVDYFALWGFNMTDDSMHDEFYPTFPKSQLWPDYIAFKSGHSRGSTMDLTIVPVPTPPQANTNTTGLTPLQVKNRQFLVSSMAKRGFTNYDMEWWHYTLDNEPFPDTYFNFYVE